MYKSAATTATGISIYVRELDVRYLYETQMRTAFCVSGQAPVSVLRWSVEGERLPIGTEPADVAAHYAAQASALGVPLTTRSLEPDDVLDAIDAARNPQTGRPFFVPCARNPQPGRPTIAAPTALKTRIFSVRTENQVFALCVDERGIMMTPASVNKEAAAARAAAVKREIGRPADADAAAADYLECVKQAIADPAVMTYLFDVSSYQPFEDMRRAFTDRPYVREAMRKYSQKSCGK